MTAGWRRAVSSRHAESRTLIAESSLTSVARLADVARQDPDFMQVGEVYRNDPAFDVERLVAELVEAESVPLLPVLRYKPSGLRKRAEWEQTWELQREEDKRSAVSGQRSAVSGQRSAVSGQRSAVSSQQSAVSKLKAER